MESAIVKLTDLVNVDYASTNDIYPNWLAADLTQQEISKLIPMAQRIVHTQFPLVNFRPERLDGLFSSEGLGYLAPDKVRIYYIEDLSQAFEGGLLHQIVIDFKDSWQNGRIGTYTYWHPYDRNKIPQGISPGQKGGGYSDSGYDVLSGPVLIDDEPATQYIVEDCAGKFVPISQSWIESLISKGLRSAENIGTFNPNEFVWPNLEKAEKLAKATGNDDLVHLVNAAMEHAGSLVTRGPDRHKEALRQRSIYTGTPRYRVELSDELLLSWQSGMGEYDNVVNQMIRTWKGVGGVDSKLFPYSLESLSTQSVVELMKHFASKDFDLDYIQQHMKIVKIG